VRAPVDAPDFFLIRHGETEWNREGRLQGQLDIPLNPVGRDQASGAGRALKALLGRRGLDPARLRYTASPLGRARATMEILRAALGLDPAAYHLDDRLKELSFGQWEGRTWPELKALDAQRVRARKRDKWSFVPPDGESYDGLAARILPWLSTVGAGDVVVAHGGVARALMTLLTPLARAEAPDVEIVQGRVLCFSQGRCYWA
jgi:broad specificity phosphatase PhoE